jgi:hypothetical protein
MYVQHNTEVCSSNHCCSGKPLSMTLWMCALVTRHVHRFFYAPYYNVISVLCGCTKFFHIISHTTLFSEKKERKMCVLIFYTSFVWNISHSKNNSARYYHKCTQIFMWCTRYDCQTLIRFVLHRLFEKSNSKFHELLSDGSRVLPCGQTWRR